ncbi:MAG: DNA translocase FtsK 4TM domain-containing protein, partial [Pseudomonadales bacterium]
MGSTKKESTGAEQAKIQHSVLREGALIGCAALSAILLLTLLTYDPADPGWSRTGTNDEISNAVGPTGAWLSDVFFYVFGQLAYLFPLLIAYQVIRIFREYRIDAANQLNHHIALRTAGFVFIMIAG